MDFSLVLIDVLRRGAKFEQRGHYTATRFAFQDSMTMGKSLHSVDAEEKNATVLRSRRRGEMIEAKFE